MVEATEMQKVVQMRHLTLGALKIFNVKPKNALIHILNHVLIL